MERLEQSPGGLPAVDAVIDTRLNCPAAVLGKDACNGTGALPICRPPVVGQH